VLSWSGWRHIEGQAAPTSIQNNYPISFGHNDLHCLPALNGATCPLGNFPECLTYARPRRQGHRARPQAPPASDLSPSCARLPRRLRPLALAHFGVLGPQLAFALTAHRFLRIRRHNRLRVASETLSRMLALADDAALARLVIAAAQRRARRSRGRGHARAASAASARGQ
jgi:hypothetical protein